MDCRLLLPLKAAAQAGCKASIIKCTNVSFILLLQEVMNIGAAQHGHQLPCLYHIINIINIGLVREQIGIMTSFDKSACIGFAQKG